MLKIYNRQATVSLKPEQYSELTKLIAEHYSPLIAEVKQEYITRLNLPSEQQDGLNKGNCIFKTGEIFLAKDSGILYYAVSQDCSTFMLGGVFKDKQEHIFEEFAGKVEQAFNKIDPKMKFEWQTSSPRNIATLTEETLQVNLPEKKELVGADNLQNSDNFKLLSFLQDVKNIYLQELMDKIPEAKNPEQLAQMEKAGLIQRDFVVLCQKTNQQILRVGSKTGLEDSAQKGLKCYICGNLLSAEKTEEIISPSEIGLKLLKENLWLRYLVVDCLNKLNFTTEEIRIAPDAPNHMFLTINGEALLLVLLTQPLELTHAQLINAHILSYGIQELILLSKKTIPTLIKGYLAQNNPTCKIHYLENLDKMENELGSILKQSQEDKVIEQLKPFDELTQVLLHNLLIKSLPQMAGDDKMEAVGKGKGR